MRTPKELFLVGGFAPQLKEAAAKEWFEAALNHAFAQFCIELRRNTTSPTLPIDAFVAVDANGQREGAQRVLEILQTLADPVKQTEPPKQQKLNYA